MAGYNRDEEEEEEDDVGTLAFPAPPQPAVYYCARRYRCCKETFFSLSQIQLECG